MSAFDIVGIVLIVIFLFWGLSNTNIYTSNDRSDNRDKTSHRSRTKPSMPLEKKKRKRSS